MKPQKNKNEKVNLKFMDCSVSLESAGKTKEIEKRALRLLSVMLQDRIKIMELISELDHDDDEPGKQRKSKKLKPKVDNLKLGYV